MGRQKTTTTTFAMTIKHKILTGVFLLYSATSNALPPEFSASYLAEAYGVIAAQANYKLEYKNNGIIFTQHSSTTGIAAIFSDDELNETSYLSLHNNKLLLDEYHFEHKGSDKNRDIYLKIQWDDTDKNKLSGIITGTASGKPVKYDVTTEIWDTLSFQIPLMMDNSNKSREYTLVVKGELKKYTFIPHNKETLTIGNNTIDTIKIERKSDNNKKPLYLWIAPSLNNIPVKIEKWKKGKPHITMILNTASFPSNANLKFNVDENFDDE